MEGKFSIYGNITTQITSKSISNETLEKNKNWIYINVVLELTKYHLCTWEKIVIILLLLPLIVVVLEVMRKNKNSIRKIGVKNYYSFNIYPVSVTVKALAMEQPWDSYEISSKFCSLSLLICAVQKASTSYSWRSCYSLFELKRHS